MDNSYTGHPIQYTHLISNHITEAFWRNVKFNCSSHRSTWRGQH